VQTFKRELAAAIAAVADVPPETLEGLFSSPPDRSLGDLALPCFPLAKLRKTAPPQIAAELAEADLGVPWVKEVRATGPYLNFRFDRGRFSTAALAELRAAGEEYGRSETGRERTVVIDYSSPNIAKHLAVHHLRSTMLGQAMANLFRAAGYRVVGVNHLGDWGTSFGKLLCAMEHFGEAEGLTARPLAERDDPIATLNSLYTRFHAEMETRPELEEEAREWFRRLETGDPLARARWREIRDLSLARFQRLYDRLGVSFDEVIGESAFEERMGTVVEELEASGLLEESEDAQVVSVGEDVPPFLVRKKDGTTLYGTRDLAAVQQRWETWHFDRCLYVVDAGQGLHFRQLFTVVEKLGWPCADRLEHSAFGVMRMPVDGGWAKGRTRDGRVVLLEEVLDHAVECARRAMEEKGAEVDDPEATAEAVGVGAVIFSDMKARRGKDVNFDLDKIVSFEGETGPYLQYTHVRFCGILRKAAGYSVSEATGQHLDGEADLALLQEVLLFPEVVARAAEEAEPSIVGQYLLGLASSFNAYYAQHRVLDDDPAARGRTTDRLALVDRLRVTFRNGLRWLGIAPLERM
jgi:arginyl-tRNA synthetase